jgi:hypothetical protein
VIRPTGAGFGQSPFGLVTLDHLRAAEDDNRRVDLVTVQVEFDLLQFQLHPDRTHVGMTQQFRIFFSQPVTGRGQDRF